jgi:hypothetical protein
MDPLYVKCQCRRAFLCYDQPAPNPLVPVKILAGPPNLFNDLAFYCLFGGRVE